jgi:fructan beta-fructosidase
MLTRTMTGRWRVRAIALIAVLSAAVAGTLQINSAWAQPVLTVENGGFETGDLTGWQVLEGDAFTDAGVSDAPDWGWGCCFEREGAYHYWGHASGGDASTGRMRSSAFTLGGVGHISFKLGGGNDIDHLYVALMRASDDTELMRASNIAFNDSERLTEYAWDASAYLGEELYLLVVDSSSGGWGHLGLDDVQTYHETPIVEPPLGAVVANGGFETGDLTGWQTEGEAFTVTDERFKGREGDWYLRSDVEATGEVRSRDFLLSGDGTLKLLLAGSGDVSVSAVRAEDGAVLATAEPRKKDRFKKVEWDLSEHLGEILYLQADDAATDGRVFLDGVDTLSTTDAHWAFDEGSGATAEDDAAGIGDDVAYVFNDAADKPDSDPLWRDGVHDGALLFDGYSTWLQRPAAQSHVPGSTLAVEAWVAPRSYEWGDGGKPSVIVNQQDRAANAGYELGMGRFGELTFGVGDGLAWHDVSTAAYARLEKDTWSHVVGVYDGVVGRLELYVNGESVASDEVPAGRYIVPSNADLMVGKHNESVQIRPFSANMFSGLIDDLAVGDNIPTAEEITDAYEAGLVDGELPPAATECDRSRYDGDRYRPQYHFLPPEHWMNEPHAPIFYNGQYHLFYQHNPQGPYWHQIHWGHMVSDDLVHWEDAPIALAPTEGSVAPDGVWSGSATYDANGDPVLFFTAGNDSAALNQQTGLAFPTTLEGNLPDWEMHSEIVTTQTPDLPVGDGLEVMYGHFRDPFVWQEGDTWYQLVGSGVREAGGGPAVGGTALVYTSTDLIDWDYKGPLFTGDIAEHPETSEVWELPVLLPVGKDAQGNEKHVFLVNDHWPDGYDERNSKSVPYWVGTWDAEAGKFIPDDEDPRLLDYGAHFTGPSGMVTPDGRAVVFTITQDGRSDWDHYDAGWAHSMGMPAELKLRDDGTVGLAPLEEFQSLRGDALVSAAGIELAEANALLEDAQGDMTDMLEVQIELTAADAAEFGVELRRSADGTEGTTFTVDREASTYAVDRNRSSLDPDTQKGVHSGEFAVNEDGTVTFHAFVDRSSLEVFANDQLMTTRVYPTLADSTGLRLFADGEVEVKSIEVWNMDSIYGEAAPSHFEEPEPESDTTELANHDFASCDLTGWTAEGTAFTDAHVSDATSYGWGGPFRQANASGSTDRCHLWGFNADAGGEDATGTLRSKEFVLGGDGHIDFLLSGGKDADNLYAALVDAETGEILFSQTGFDGEQYLRHEWDAAEYLGRSLYFTVVDNDTGGWGHLNLDDVNVPVAPGD